MRVCIRCSKEIVGRNKQAVYCSDDCREQGYADKRHELNGARSNLPTGTTGAIHELAVSIDLMRKGYLAFRSLSPSCPVDLVVLHGEKVIRVEVTTGMRGLNSELIYPPHTKNKLFFDVIAVVERNGQITYVPELPQTPPVPRKPAKCDPIKPFSSRFKTKPFLKIAPSDPM